LQRQRLQTVLAHGAEFGQLLPVTQHSQYFPTLNRRSMQTRKLIIKHQIQNEFSVAPIVLLPPTSAAPDLGRMT